VIDLEDFCQNMKNLKTKHFLDYNHVRTDISNNFPAVTRGMAKEFYDNYTYQQTKLRLII
jgi:aspartate oxidase